MSPLYPLHVASVAQAIALGPIALALAYWLPEAVPGCLWGGAIMAVNFAMMRGMGKAWLSQGVDTVSGRVAVLLLAKFAVLSTLTLMVLTYAHPHKVGFALGLGTFFVASVATAIQCTFMMGRRGPHRSRT